MRGVCPNCGIVELTVAQQIGGRIACAAAGAMFGAGVMKHPAAALLCGLVGAAIGQRIDAELSKHCPKCGAILRIAGLLFR